MSPSSRTTLHPQPKAASPGPISGSTHSPCELQENPARQSRLDPHVSRHVPVDLHRNGEQSCWAPFGCCTVWPSSRHTDAAAGEQSWFIVHTKPMLQSPSESHEAMHEMASRHCKFPGQGVGCPGSQVPLLSHVPAVSFASLHVDSQVVAGEGYAHTATFSPSHDPSHESPGVPLQGGRTPCGSSPFETALHVPGKPGTSHASH